MFFQWAAICFLIALVAGAFGCADISSRASHIARILFYVSLTLFIVLVILTGSCTDRAPQLRAV
jgi:uncharacterized membrane protein YtjA (UPF0391 family)